MDALTRCVLLEPSLTAKGSGWVYLLQVRDALKIGMTTVNLHSRVAQIQSSCPDGVYIVEAVRTLSPKRLENRLHGRFAHARIRGEWFTNTPAILEGFQELARFAVSFRDVYRVGGHYPESCELTDSELHHPDEWLTNATYRIEHEDGTCESAQDGAESGCHVCLSNLGCADWEEYESERREGVTS